MRCSLAAAWLPFLGPGGPAVRVHLPSDDGAGRRWGAVYSSGIQKHRPTRPHTTGRRLPFEQGKVWVGEFVSTSGLVDEAG